MYHNKFFWVTSIIFISLSLALVGCSSTPVQVTMAQPEEIDKGAEILDMRNCDSNDELVTNLAAEAPVQMHITIAEQCTLDKTGSTIVIPDHLVDYVRAQIEEEYAPVFEETTSNTAAEKFQIPGHMIHMYKIKWLQKTYKSTASFSIDHQSCIAFYTYTLDYPILNNSTSMACTA